jgi:hypothetical protein
LIEIRDKIARKFKVQGQLKVRLKRFITKDRFEKDAKLL